MADWQEKMTSTIGQQVKKHRADRSLLWLENRTSDLGFKVSRGALSQLETGKRRSVSVAEWLILAAALEVPPLLLLWPNFPDGEVEMTPGFTAEAFDAFRWSTGDFTYRHMTFYLEDGETAEHDGMTLANAPHPLIALVKQILDDPIPSWVLAELGDKNMSSKVMDYFESRDRKRRKINAQINALGGFAINRDDDDGEG